MAATNQYLANPLNTSCALQSSQTSLTTLYDAYCTGTSNSNSLKMKCANQQKQSVSTVPALSRQAGSDEQKNENISDSESQHDADDEPGSEEARCLKENGYLRVAKVSDTLQGEIFEATTLDDNKHVFIKKVDKELHSKRICVQDGMSFLVESDVIKESIISHHLTVQNQPLYNYLAKFVKIFMSESTIYLVLEQAAGITLQQFMQRAHQCLDEEKMSIKHWKQIVKYIAWQISVIVYWLHHDMNCCNLSLNLNNIMVLDADFIENDDGLMKIRSNLQIKIIDFGYSEIFKVQHKEQEEVHTPFTPFTPSSTVNNPDVLFDVVRAVQTAQDDYDDEYDDNEFKCNKRIMTEKSHLLAPRVYADDTYDARKADMWSIGVMVYQLATGLDPYDSADDDDANYLRIKQHRLMELLRVQHREKYVSTNMLALMVRLLAVPEKARISAAEVLQCKWFELYFRRYKSQIEQKSITLRAQQKQIPAEIESDLYHN